MNILIISQYFWPEPFKINDFAIEMVKFGHNITVLTGKPNYPDGQIYKDFKHKPDNYDELKGIKIVRVPIFPRGKNSFSLLINYISFIFSSLIIGYIKINNKSFDFVFVNQLSPVTIGLTGIFFAKIYKAPLIMWVLDLWPESLIAIGASKLNIVYKIFGSISYLIYSKCDLIFSSSKGFIPLLKKRCKKTTKIIYFPNWAEPAFNKIKRNTVSEIPYKKDTFDIMFAGNIGEAQDFKCILEAAEEIRDKSNVRWLIVGNGRKYSWVQNQIKVRGLKDTILLTGRFKRERMPDFFEQANCLLITLKNTELFSLTVPGKLQSYLAAGKPIIGAVSGECAKLLTNSKCGLVSKPSNAKALAHNVLKMSKMSKKSRRIMGINAKLLYENEFERDKLISKAETDINKFLTKAV